MRTIRLVVSAALAVTALGLPAPAAGAATPPRHTYSHYMKSTDPYVLNKLGCDAGRMAQDGVVVLAFGRPAYSNGLHGTIIFGANTFRSTAQIEAAAKQWLSGYYGCSSSVPRVVLAPGTSNYKGTTGYAHGKAWAGMINNLAAWLGQKQFAWQLGVAGASDMELSWNTAAVTRAWADGYGSAAVRRYYNFGDAAGCPPYGSCNNGWRQEDVWYVSWGQPTAWPVPEIYTTNGSMATQWYRLSVYSHLYHGARMDISGTMTQHAACLDVGGCTNGTDNTPAAGWTQLYNKLNADGRTAQPLHWSTDITWKNTLTV